MRIALINNFFVPRPSGSVHLTEGLAKSLTARGHDVLVITAAHKDAPADEIRDGYRVVRLPCWAPPKTRLSFNYDIPMTLGPRNLRRLFAMLDDFRPDVVHQHGQFFDLTWMSAFWARRRGVPTVLTVHTALIHADRAAGAVLWLGDSLFVRPMTAIGHPHVVLIDWFIDTLRPVAIPPARRPHDAHRGRGRPRTVRRPATAPPRARSSASATAR